MKHYHLTIKSGVTEADVTVEGLVLWKDIYGDELMPIIMYLQTDSEVVPYVSILTTNLVNQDDLLLTELDPYFLADVFQTNKENATMVLQTSADIGRVDQFLHPEPSSIIMTSDRKLLNFDDVPLTTLDKIAVDDTVGLEAYLKELTNELGISCDTVTLVGISYLPLSGANNATLTTAMTEDAKLNIYLQMDEYGLWQLDPRELTSLDQFNLSELDYIDREMNLTQSVIDLGITYLLPQTTMSLPLKQDDDTTVNLRETVKLASGITMELEQSGFDLYFLRYLSGESTMRLHTSATAKTRSNLLPAANTGRITTGLDYKQFLDAYDNLQVISLDNETLIDLDGSDDYIHLEAYYDATNSIVISGTAEIITEPSAARYDYDPLTSLDPYTIYDLENDTITETQE